MSHNPRNISDTLTELSDEQLDEVSGGLNPQPLPPAREPHFGIGSQTSGAGAGKVTFIPTSTSGEVG